MHIAHKNHDSERDDAVVGANNIVSHHQFRNSIIEKDRHLGELYELEEDSLEKQRRDYLKYKKKTEDEAQLYNNLLEIMFPGYALTYYEQQQNSG
jgi:hypothetical protein